MVATTPIYALPYMEGTDPPCFGADCDHLESVFCDFMTLVEAQLNENDNVIGRTATAIPMCQVANTTSQPYYDAVDGIVLTFDTVVFDTDNMATLPTGITPRRNGQYRFDMQIQLNLSPADVGIAQRFPAVFGIDNAPGTMTGTQAVDPDQAVLTVQASTLYSFTGTSPVPRVVFIRPDFSLSVNTVFNSAFLTCYWHSDL